LIDRPNNGRYSYIFQFQERVKIDRVIVRRSFDDDNLEPQHHSPSADPSDSFVLETATGDTAPFRIPEDAQIYSYDSEGKFYSFVSI
jgi:hypothetical protein